MIIWYTYICGYLERYWRAPNWLCEVDLGKCDRAWTVKRCDGRRRKILKSIKRWQRCQTSLTQFIPILFKGVSTFSQLPAIENLNRKIDIQYFDMPPENPFIHVFGRHFVTWNNEPRTSFTIHWRKPSSLLLASLYLYYTPNPTTGGNTEKYCQKPTFASVCQCHWSYRSSLQASALLPSHVLCRFLSFLPNHRLHLHLVLRSVTKLVRIIKTKNMMNAKNPKNNFWGHSIVCLVNEWPQ